MEFLRHHQPSFGKHLGGPCAHADSSDLGIDPGRPSGGGLVRCFLPGVRQLRLNARSGRRRHISNRAGHVVRLGVGVDRRPAVSFLRIQTNRESPSCG